MWPLIIKCGCRKKEDTLIETLYSTFILFAQISISVILLGDNVTPVVKKFLKPQINMTWTSYILKEVELTKVWSLSASFL